VVEGLIRLAVFGMPVAHSLSPAIHRQFARQCNLEIDYRAIETGPEGFADKLRELVLSGGRGCNITVPLKRLAWRLARRSSPSALRAQAANTMVFGNDNDHFADNTDGRGLIRDLSRCLSAPISDRHILIIGAGGAAAGILGDLLEQSPAQVMLANRSPDRARELAQRFTSMGRVSSCGLDELNILGPFDLVINATSLGHLGSTVSLPESLFSSDSLCYDLNYGPAAEPLRRQCEKTGVNYSDGLGMLVEQAACSFTLWTGRHPDTGAVLQAIGQHLPHSVL